MAANVFYPNSCNGLLGGGPPATMMRLQQQRGLSANNDDDDYDAHDYHMGDGHAVGSTAAVATAEMAAAIATPTPIMCTPAPMPPPTRRRYAAPIADVVKPSAGTCNAAVSSAPHSPSSTSSCGKGGVCAMTAAGSDEARTPITTTTVGVINRRIGADDYYYAAYDGLSDDECYYYDGAYEDGCEGEADDCGSVAGNIDDYEDADEQGDHYAGDYNGGDAAAGTDIDAGHHHHHATAMPDNADDAFYADINNTALYFPFNVARHTHNPYGGYVAGGGGQRCCSSRNNSAANVHHNHVASITIMPTHNNTTTTTAANDAIMFVSVEDLFDGMSVLAVEDDTSSVGDECCCVVVNGGVDADQYQNDFECAAQRDESDGILVVADENDDDEETFAFARDEEEEAYNGDAIVVGEGERISRGGDGGGGGYLGHTTGHTANTITHRRLFGTSAIDSYTYSPLQNNNNDHHHDDQPLTFAFAPNVRTARQYNTFMWALAQQRQQRDAWSGRGGGQTAIPASYVNPSDHLGWQWEVRIDEADPQAVAEEELWLHGEARKYHHTEQVCDDWRYGDVAMENTSTDNAHNNADFGYCHGADVPSDELHGFIMMGEQEGSHTNTSVGAGDSDENGSANNHHYGTAAYHHHNNSRPTATTASTGGPLFLTKSQLLQRRTGLSAEEVAARFPYRSEAIPFPTRPVRPNFPEGITSTTVVKCCYYAQRPVRLCRKGDGCFHAHDDDDEAVVPECHGDGKDRSEVRGGTSTKGDAKANKGATTTAKPSAASKTDDDIIAQQHQQIDEGICDEGDDNTTAPPAYIHNGNNKDAARPYLGRSDLANVPCHFGPRCALARHSTVAKRCGFTEDHLDLYNKYIFDLSVFVRAVVAYREAVKASGEEAEGIAAATEAYNRRFSGQGIRGHRSVSTDGHYENHEYVAPAEAVVPSKSAATADNNGTNAVTLKLNPNACSFVPPTGTASAAATTIRVGHSSGPHQHHHRNPVVHNINNQHTQTHHNLYNPFDLAPFKAMWLPCAHCGARSVPAAAAAEPSLLPAPPGITPQLPTTTNQYLTIAPAVQLLHVPVYRPNPNYDGIRDVRKEIKKVGVSASCKRCQRTFAFDDGDGLRAYAKAWEGVAVNDAEEEEEEGHGATAAADDGGVLEYGNTSNEQSHCGEVEGYDEGMYLYDDHQNHYRQQEEQLDGFEGDSYIEDGYDHDHHGGYSQHNADGDEGGASCYYPQTDEHHQHQHQPHGYYASPQHTTSTAYYVDTDLPW